MLPCLEKKFDVSLFRSQLEMHTETHQFRKIIQSVTLSDFCVMMENQDEAFTPLSGSNNTLTEYYKILFGFSLQVIQSAVDMTLATGCVPQRLSTIFSQRFVAD